MLAIKKTAYSTGLAKVAFQCSVEIPIAIGMVNQSLVFRINSPRRMVKIATSVKPETVSRNITKKPNKYELKTDTSKSIRSTFCRLNLFLAICSTALLASASIQQGKIQNNKLYMQTVEKNCHLHSYQKSVDRFSDFYSDHSI